MTRVNLSKARTQLSSLVDRAASGEEIVIAKHGRPMVRLMPLSHRKKGPRKPKNLLGLTYIADDFDAPWVLMPEEQTGRRKKGKRR